ncbi:hypothetical protein ACIGXI_29595 [Kitasatospora aureofaciens]|uniref:hypothetical protein n=1 Tax=Kitasatospora aureofaciens TaxID=1894 RepID=UPI0037CA0430
MVATTVAAKPCTPGSVLDRIVATPPTSVKDLRTVAAHPDASPTVLATCPASADPRTAAAAAANPAPPVAVMAEPVSRRTAGP